MPKTATKKPETVKPVDADKAAEFQERAEADFDPAETARERLARLESETKGTLDKARKEAREEAKKESDEEFGKIVQPELDRMLPILREIEAKTGKIFRSFSFYFKFPKGATEPDVKFTHSLVTARGESTEDEETEETDSNES